MLYRYKYAHVEWRVSIYGRKLSEWSSLASWVCTNNLFHENVRWLVQTPRLYNVYREANVAGVSSFGDLIRNVCALDFDCDV